MLVEIRLFYHRHPTEPYVKYTVALEEDPEWEEFWELEPTGMYRTLQMFPQLLDWNPIH